MAIYFHFDYAIDFVDYPIPIYSNDGDDGVYRRDSDEMTFGLDSRAYRF